MFVPLKQGRPVWVAEPQFDLESHLRHTALPAPGGEAELKKLVGRLCSRALERDKPLWEMWLVEGLGESRFAIVSKTHHCMLDGVSGVDLATVLMDRHPDPSPPTAPAPWKPRKAPKAADLLVSSIKEQLSNPLRMAREALQPNSEAVKLLSEVFSGLRPFVEAVTMGRAPQSPLNVPIGPHRRFEMVEVPLAKGKTLPAAHRRTGNDVILATVAGALRSWLSARHGPAETDLRVLVPVSMRSRKARRAYGNQGSAAVCTRPLTEAGPVQRLGKVHGAMMTAMKSGSAGGAPALSPPRGFSPPPPPPPGGPADGRSRGV